MSRRLFENDVDSFFPWHPSCAYVMSSGRIRSPNKDRLAAENICVSDTSICPCFDRHLFDFDSVNEAVINALVQNDWNVSQPLISIFSDRIEILPHGGLPKGQTRELFFRGISKPRNDMLMRIFLNMNLTEHTRHGIPAILSKYGEAAFDIGDSYILVTIPYDKDVINVANQNKNVGLNVGLNAAEKKVLSHLIETPEATADDMASAIGVTKRTIERTLKKLQEKGLLVRSGAKKSGNWIVIK